VAESIPVSNLASTINYLLDNVLGLDRDNQLVHVTASRSTGKNNDITIEIRYTLGPAAAGVVDFFSFVVNEDKLKGSHDEAIKVEEIIRENLTDFVKEFVSKQVEGMDGHEGAIARAATDALNKLLVSELLNPIAKHLAASLTLLELPGSEYITTIEHGLDRLSSEYFKAFVPEIAKTYAKLGLAEILTYATSDSSPQWATAIRSVGEGVLHPVIDNIVKNYFAEVGEEQVDIFKDIEFTKIFGNAVANLLIDFEALDKEILDDFLGLDGENLIEEWVHDLLSGQIKDFVQDQFVDAMKFLAGKFEGEDFANLFRDFADFNVQEILGNLFTNFAGSQLAGLFVEIDSLPEALLSQLGSTIGSGVLGEALGSLAIDFVAGLFGEATASAIGAAIFEGLGSILGAGIGAIAGSVVFELLDELFDGAISDLFEGIIDWIRNDSPQAFYRTTFDPVSNEFEGGYLYSKDSDSDLRQAVEATMKAFEGKINAVIDFVGEPASFDTYFDTITFVWGKKHFNESYASYITGNEANKLSYNRSAEHVAKETVGAVLSHMNFHNGHPITALAFDMWKAEVAAAGGSSLSYFAPDNLLNLQNIVGLAHFANDYRQDPTFYDLLMASDAPIAVTILQQFLEAEARGFNAATTLEGRVLGFETVGSAAAGDTLVLNGIAWQAIARGGDDTIVAGVAALQKVDGGTGNDRLVLAKARDAYAATVTDEASRTVVLTDIASGAVIQVTEVETFTFAGTVLTFEQAFPNGRPVILSNGGGDSAAIKVLGNSLVVTTVASYDPDGDARTYFIAGGTDSELFRIDETTGLLTFRTAPNVDAPGDADHDNIYDVRVGVSDGRVSDVQRLAVEVTVPVSGSVIRGTNGADRIEYGQRPTPGPQPTTRDDLIYGGNGADRLSGGPGADRLHGGDGADILSGGDGNDLLSGARGADQMAGGTGNDVYYIGEAGDSVTEAAGAGTDEVRTSLADTSAPANVENMTGLLDTGQTLRGNALGNLFTGGGGADRMVGLAGDDVYRVEAGDIVVEKPGEGTDEVRTALAAYALTADVERLVGTSGGGQSLTGNALANTITGGAGNDRIDGGAGVDEMAGGSGSDVYFVGQAGDLVVEGANAGTDEVRTALVDSTAPVNVENITGLLNTGQTLRGNGLANMFAGGAGADRFVGGLGNDVYLVAAGDIVIEKVGEGTDEVRTGLAVYSLTADVERLVGTSAAGQSLTGNALANVISGGSGNDRIDGAGGGDQMAGGAGNDVYYVDHVADVVTEGANAGIDEIRTALGDSTAPVNVEKITGLLNTGQTLRGNGLANVFAGGGGADRFVGGLGNDIYWVGAGDIIVEKPGEGLDEARTALAAYVLAAEVERLTGTSAGGQSLTGNALANIIAGGSGNDRIDGGAGVDQMAGGLGDDVYFMGQLGDIVSEAFNAGIDELRTSLADTAAPANVENITGLLNTGQTLRGNGLDNVIAGGTGADRFVGGLGNDVYVVGAGDNVIEKAGEGIDEVRTGLASYALTAEVERLVGTGAGQTLSGNALANVIVGGGGADKLWGGGGADSFRYQSTSESAVAARDQLLDFTPGTDKIDLERIDARSNSAGDQAFTWIGASAFGKSAGELRAYQSGANWIVEGDVNGDGLADFAIVLTLQGATPLGAGDFVL